MADVTNDFVDLLRTNGRVARAMGVSASLTSVGGLGGVIAGGVALHTWFYYKVRNHGDWDLKNNVFKAYKKTGLDIAGKHYDNDMPGNFHFGFVGRAAGFPAVELFWGAGEAQKRAGTSRPEYYCTYGDDPEDNEFIRLGVKLYEDYGLSFAVNDLKTVLAGFQSQVCPAR
jgi:hypothetical protein